ncbi:hypothetical protein PM8797T_08154 [Gimesia maris DSM 8797]|nr:hypothetical protein PM8797T_08154 [Gimesia maris DSM 8797]
MTEAIKMFMLRIKGSGVAYVFSVRVRLIDQSGNFATTKDTK